MNGDFLEICDTSLPAVIGAGLRKAVRVGFLDSVAAAYARRHVMYTISVLQRLDALAGREGDTKKVDKRGDCRTLIAACERELRSKIEKAARDADALKLPVFEACEPAIECVFGIRSVEHLPFVNTFLLLDRLACQVRRRQRARALTLQDASSVVHSGKCAIKHLMKEVEGLASAAERELGESLARYYYQRTFGESRAADTISSRRKRRLGQALRGKDARLTKSPSLSY